MRMINMTFSAHLANVIANWAEMEFAALRLITFVTLAGSHHCRNYHCLLPQRYHIFNHYFKDLLNFTFFFFQWLTFVKRLTFSPKGLTFFLPGVDIGVAVYARYTEEVSISFFSPSRSKSMQLHTNFTIAQNFT